MKRLLLMIILMGLNTCSGAPPAQETELVDVLKIRPGLTRFAEVLESSGVASMLLPDGNDTVVVPIN